MYKAAFIDLDGTLLTKGKKIASQDLKILVEYAKKGGSIVLNSGRWHPSVLNFANQINKIFENAVPYIGSYNGASLYDVRQKKFLWQNFIDHEMLRKAVEVSNKFKIVALIYSQDGKSLFLNRFPLKFLFDRYLNGKTLKARKHLDNQNGISKIIFISASLKKMEKAWTYISQNFQDKYNICLTHSRVIEVNAFSSNKGIVVDKVLSDLNLKNDDGIAFGDSYNDLAMFKKTNFSVLFNNHKIELKNNVPINCPKGTSFGLMFQKYAMNFEIDAKNFFIDCSLINKSNINQFKLLVTEIKSLNKKVILISNKDFDVMQKINEYLGNLADLIIHNGIFFENKIESKVLTIQPLKNNEVVFYYTNSTKVFYNTRIENFDIDEFIKNNFLFLEKEFEKINIGSFANKIVSAERFYLLKEDNNWKLDYASNFKISRKHKKNLENCFQTNEITPNDSVGFFTQLISLNFPKEVLTLSMDFNKNLEHFLKKIKQ